MLVENSRFGCAIRVFNVLTEFAWAIGSDDDLIRSGTFKTKKNRCLGRRIHTRQLHANTIHCSDHCGVWRVACSFEVANPNILGIETEDRRPLVRIGQLEGDILQYQPFKMADV
jgi:hypothetical protein